MIEISDIEKAIAENRPLFYNGSEISSDAYDYLTKQSKADIDILFAEFPASKPKHPMYFHVFFNCPLCDKLNSIKLTKNQFKSCMKGGFDSLIKIYGNLSLVEEYDIIENLRIHKIDESIENLKGVCNECISFLQKKINEKFNVFYDNPLEWVNTNSSEIHSWQWDKVVKLYTYPIGYENIPEGCKYCGVRFRKRDSKSVSEMYDLDYYNWKSVREKTVVERKISSVHELLNDLVGDLRYSDTTTMAHKKAINIAEQLLEGLVSNVDLPALLKHISKECKRIIDNVKRNSNPSRIISFGKYKGMTIHEVIGIDPQYIYWALNVVEGFTLTDDEKAHYNGEDWMVEKDCKTQDIQEETLSEEREESSKEKEDEEYRPLKADALPF